MGWIEIQPQSLIHLTRVERNLVTGAVVELGGAWAFVRGYGLLIQAFRFLQRERDCRGTYRINQAHAAEH
jgi:hypothetical protein